METSSVCIYKDISCRSAVITLAEIPDVDLPLIIHTVGVLSRWKCASFKLSPWLPWGLDKPNRRSFRKSLDVVVVSNWALFLWHRFVQPTLFRSKRQTLYSEVHGSLKLQQFHLRPIEMYEIVRVRAGNDPRHHHHDFLATALLAC